MLRFSGLMVLAAVLTLQAVALELKAESTARHAQAVAEPRLHEGTVVSASAGQVSMRATDGKEQVFKINSMTRVTINGKPGKVEALEAGTPIRVMVDQANNVTAISTVDDRKHL
ncbi:hypothetical protein ETAA8_19460 [Anatilimnocola aggregata]|uniref:DUF5666 domain-containing protein n=1 Tax=Anatilimnocola aggregata TaxID=2528021 RepID=A0A517Y9M3_9BACT|nr:hypothetical protein [Anatilimnocola aggregata]QDU26862.1 hypothetical protein ETAA8_19460 [Anatilimnocola aggregata]